MSGGTAYLLSDELVVYPSEKVGDTHRGVLVCTSRAGLGARSSRRDWGPDSSSRAGAADATVAPESPAAALVDSAAALEETGASIGPGCEVGDEEFRPVCRCAGHSGLKNGVSDSRKRLRSPSLSPSPYSSL